MQRQEEQKLRDECVKLNSEMSREEAGNFLYKVVGPRGNRRVVKTTLDLEEDEPGRAPGQGTGRVRLRSSRGRGGRRGGH